jgi:hypothetical protein
MTEAQFADISLKVCFTLLIGYMMFIIYKLGKESKAGNFGMFILFIGLGLGFVSFGAKEVIKLILAH